MHNLLVDLKAVSGKKINVLGKKTPIVKEAPAEEAKATVAVAEAVAVAPVVAEEAAEEVVAETVEETPKAE